jgi:lipoprotein NlpI
MSQITSSESALREANALFVDENYDEALQQYNLAVELDSSNEEAYLKRSICFYKLGNFKGRYIITYIL